MASIEGKSTTAVNRLKWLLVGLIIVVAVVGNIYFDQYALAMRATVLIVVGVLTVCLAKTTTEGQFAWGFLKEARVEMRKVVWPTRHETIQTALLVIGVVIVMSLILWAVDSLFAVIVSSIVI